jgi:hypothetical protein
MPSSRWPALSLSALILAGCAVHAPAPARAPVDAAGGHAPLRFDPARACTEWRKAHGPRSHASFPELDPRGCFVPVRYGPDGPRPDPTPEGCGYPAGAETRAHLERAAARYERIAVGDAGERLPLDLACGLPEGARAVAARHNARALRALSRRIEGEVSYPYAAVSTFGFGHPEQGRSALVSYRPGDACPALDRTEMRRLSVNVTRAGRAAEAYFARVAPVITVSGGAVHSPLVEAFMLDGLLTCRFGVPETAVLLDPCADHTHTNIRNTGSLLRTLGGRTGYLVTDDGLQATYLEEWTSFDLVGGSIDQRSIRDFGYLLGSWRRASVGMPAGFWYTPYRFWAEPPDALGSFSCLP